eukprot:1972161-Heterocapsa_arctica.AAC.1
MGVHRIARHPCGCALVPLLAGPAEVIKFPERDNSVHVLTHRPCWGFVTVALPPRSQLSVILLCP